MPTGRRFDEPAYLELRGARRNLRSPEIEQIILEPDRVINRIDVYLSRYARADALIALLRTSENPIVRYEVCRVLHSVCAASARQALLEALFDRDSRVREAAADAY